MVEVFTGSVGVNISSWLQAVGRSVHQELEVL